MAKSSALSYHPPFRYKRPADDLQAVFGAQTGNPPVVRAENGKAGKRPTPPKKRPNAAAKASKPATAKTPKPAAPKRATVTKPKAKAKTKKAPGKR